MPTALEHGRTVVAEKDGATRAARREVIFIEEELLEIAADLPEPLRAAFPQALPADPSVASPATTVHAEQVDHPVATPIAHRRAGQAVLQVAFGLDLLLYGLVVPFLPVRAQMLGASPVVTGALFGSYAAGLFLATPLAGWLADRLGGRRTLLFGLFALLSATLLFAFATDLTLLFVARAAQGVAGALTWTAGLALLAQIVEDRERPAAFARIFVATGVGTLLGPSLGGALYTWGGFRAPFLVAVILVALDGIGRVLFLPGRDTHERSALARGTTRALLRDRRFVLALIATLIGAGVLALLEPTLPPLLGTRFGLHALPIGLFFGGTVLVNTLALPLVGYTTRQLGAQVTIVFGMFFAALALTMIAVSTSLVHIGIALAALGFAAPFTLVPTLELLTTLGKGDKPAEKAPYGAIYAAYNFAYAGGIFLGPLASGYTIMQLGPEAGLALPAIMPLLLGLVMFVGLSLPRKRRRSSAQAS